MVLLDRLLDTFEAYQIMTEVLFEYVPENQRLNALASASDRIFYEIKDSKRVKFSEED